MTRSELITELAANNPHLRRADVELIVTTIFDQIRTLAQDGSGNRRDRTRKLTDEHPLITKLKRANHAAPRDRAALLAIVEEIEQELRQHNPADWDRQMRELEELDKALKQAGAWLPYQRVIRLFNVGQRDLIAHVLLLNWSSAPMVPAAARIGGVVRPGDGDGQTGRDFGRTFAEHFSSEIERDRAGSGAWCDRLIGAILPSQFTGRAISAAWRLPPAHRAFLADAIAMRSNHL